MGEILMLSKVVAFEITITLNEVSYGIINSLCQTCWDSHRSAHS